MNATPCQSSGATADPQPPAPGSGGRLSPRVRAGFGSPWLPLAVFVLLACSSMARKSATYDEPIMLVSGARYLRTFDPAVNSENPPLLKALYALPTLAVGHFRAAVDADAGLRHSYSMGDEFEFASKVLFADPGHRWLLFVCRLVPVALAVCLGLALHAVCRARWNPAVATAVLWLYALCPNVLAHAQLLTPDLGCTLFVFLTALCLYRFLATGRWRWALGLGAALGAALLAKFTAVLLLPCLVLQTALFLSLSPVPRRPWRRLLPGLAGAVVLALALLQAAYGFRGVPTLLAGAPYRSPLVQRLQALPVLARLPLPVPAAYVRGFDIVAYNNQPGFPNIFLGKLYPQGGRWWYYYLVALLAKTPIPFLVAVAAGLVLCVRRARDTAAELAFFAVIPTVFLLVFSLVAYRQLGLRYILPLWPFLLLAAATAIDAAMRHWSAPGRSSRVARGLCLAGAAWYALSCLLICPDFLSYYNEWAGGPRRGWRILVESNLDWGQDLPALAAWQRRHRDPPMFVLYYGSAPPAAYGVHMQPWGALPPPPFIAISATNLFMAEGVPLVRYLRDHCEALDYAGRSILIYAITADVIEGVVREARAGPADPP